MAQRKEPTAPTAATKQGRARRGIRWVAAAVVFAAAVLARLVAGWLNALPAHASTTLTVMTQTDKKNGDSTGAVCSLRDYIAKANPQTSGAGNAVIISLPAGTYNIPLGQ